MELNYAIFRSEPIYTLQDLAQIGSHNKREKKAYNSNPDIKIELSQNNIELVPLADKYVKGFYNFTKEYKKEHDKRMETTREDRRKTFNRMLNDSKNVVADELLFTATNSFFKDMSIEDIKEWANTCMDFVYNDLGYTKEQVLHATVHMDEKTPHIHCVVVPLIKKFDKRTKSERYTISKKQYIRDKIHLSELQDKYHKRLKDKGYDLERGIKDSDNKNIKIKDFKKITRKLNNELNARNEKLNKAMENLDSKMDTNKEMFFDREYVKIKKDTFDSMENVIKETKRVSEMQPKIDNLYNEIDNYVKSYQSIEKENQKIKKEMQYLRNRNNKLSRENDNLLSYIRTIFKAIKQFLRHLLLIGNEPTKEATVTEIKEYYDNEEMDRNDIYDIVKDTSKEDELLEHIGYDIDYYDNNSYDKDDFYL